MQATVETQAPVRAKHKISTWLDLIFSQPYLYAVFAVILLRPHALLDTDALLASILQVKSFPLFRVAAYGMFTVVLLCYALRWVLNDINRVNKTLLSLLFMFLYLAGITFVFDGASGYHIDWHAGFALMMMIDMGLQREKKSLVRGLTGALEFWVYLNVVSYVIFPKSFTNSYLPAWILGTRAYYYRLVLPALLMALVRYQLLGKAWRGRTAALIAGCMICAMVQRGGTALIGFALLLGLMLWCARRALPRYATPLVFTGIAAGVFIGIYFFDVQNLFAPLITGVLGKSTTLSGRTSIWAGVVPAIAKNPISGIGYLPVAFMRKMLGGADYAHTHNQLLELMLHGGVIAVTLYGMAIYFASREALRCRRSASVKYVSLTLCAFALMGIVEIFHNDPLYYALFVLLSRADCLVTEDKKLPRISIFKRVRRDIKKLAK